LHRGIIRLQHWLALPESFSQNEAFYRGTKIENEVFPTSYTLGYFFGRMVLYWQL